jgi:GNAT superfamily N-acetyltransferase
MTLPQITIREATPEDQATILNHRTSMFRDMGEGNPQELDKMAELTGPWLAHALADGSYRGWLALDASGGVVAGAGVLISPWPASPKDPCPRRAMILNVYTQLAFRKRGIARQLVQAVLTWLKEQGFHSASLHASAEGRHLYEQLGFAATNEMRLRFGPRG